MAAGLSRRSQKWADGFESRRDRYSYSVIELESMGVMTWRLLYEESSKVAVVRDAVIEGDFSESISGRAVRGWG